MTQTCHYCGESFHDCKMLYGRTEGRQRKTESNQMHVSDRQAETLPSTHTVNKLRRRHMVAVNRPTCEHGFEII